MISISKRKRNLTTPTIINSNHTQEHELDHHALKHKPLLSSALNPKSSNHRSSSISSSHDYHQLNSIYQSFPPSFTPSIKTYHHHHHLCKPQNSNRKELRSNTPSILPRSTSALSKVSFGSFRSFNSQFKLKIQSSLNQFIQSTKSEHPSSPLSKKIRDELDWASLRAEYELQLARGSIIERCLVQVYLGQEVTKIGKKWIDRVWTLADRLSPALPAVLSQYSANGLIPLLYPLRHSLHQLGISLPYDFRQDDKTMSRFKELRQTLERTIWFAELIEKVIEKVSQVGLIKFELVGLHKAFEHEAVIECRSLEEEIFIISNWSGEIKGKTGSGNNWRGLI
ncbi:hypothetical protein O181_091080 [Austropuccinia psidii MF-1]|uniref:Uncharacterized protein n=1 Tax=Austropuccinia psidii MF-1 TaxID=1389203 RepID=A0A9Q3IX17_9BASI|nr:hypothetical protein [Austropuccinia psidii MF-1]